MTLNKLKERDEKLNKHKSQDSFEKDSDFYDSTTGQKFDRLFDRLKEKVRIKCYDPKTQIDNCLNDDLTDF
jgi:hypothetical protein